MPPHVSVIIPTHNRAALLRQALDSVLKQTYEDFEVIVVDDGSDDDTTDALVDHTDSRLKLLRIEHSGLPAVARNAGLREAQGELIAFLDSDDIWLPYKLDRQIAHLQRNAEVGLVSSNAHLMDGGGAPFGQTFLATHQGVSGRVLAELILGNFVIISTAVTRQSVLDAVGGFSETPLLRGVEDYDLWLRIAAVASVVYIEEPLALYREHASNIRHSASLSTHHRALLHIYEEFGRNNTLDAAARDAMHQRVTLYRSALSNGVSLGSGQPKGLASLLLGRKRAHVRRLFARAQVLFGIGGTRDER